MYKVTGFGGVEGTQIEDKLFYPVLQKGTGSNQFLLRVGPQKKSYNTRKSQPPQGYYNFTCLDGYSSLNDYNLTPCDGNRKYLYMTKSFSTSSKVSLYSTLYRYILAWSYRGGRTCSYSYIPVGGSSNSNWCPFYREHAIQNEDGSYRGVNSLYGWVLIKQFMVPWDLFGRSSGVQWKFSNVRLELPTNNRKGCNMIQTQLMDTIHHINPVITNIAPIGGVQIRSSTLYKMSQEQVN